MTTLTNIPPFTPGTDNRLDFTSGWSILPFSILNTLGGNDLIVGSGGLYGLYNEGELYTSSGNDTIIGMASYGYGIINQYPSLANPVVIDTGVGNDVIIAIGGDYGFVNYTSLLTDSGDDVIDASGAYVGFYNAVWGSVLKTGAGNDTLTAFSSAVDGVINFGSIYTGNGIDIISATGAGTGLLNINLLWTEAGDDQVLGFGGIVSSGIYNDTFGNLNTGAGADVVKGSASGTNAGLTNLGFLSTEAGNDTIAGTGWSGISNSGTLDSGTGNDLIQGDDSGSFFLGIYNLGVINSGDGDDTISSANSGIYNGNAILTGNGNDVLSASGGTTVSTGILNLGQIDTGAHLDKITAQGITYGIENLSTITTGTGQDLIDGSGGLDGVVNRSTGSIFTGDGIDFITGSGSTNTGVHNEGTIDTGSGTDTIQGHGSATGVSNQLSGVLYTGAGGDVVSGTGGGEGINNQGLIQTDAGNDYVLASGDIMGFVNGGATATIDTGADNDYIVANGSFNGIYNDGTIFTGTGNDSLDSSGLIAYGIENWGAIDTSFGDDTITASGGTDGILNYGTIVTGSGHDVIDALIGGFGGTGAVAMGNGNDTLMGFGTGSFSGGGGNRDRILLGDDGVYTVSMVLGMGTITLGSTSMTIGQFEWIGGASGGLFAIPFSTTSASPTALTISGGVATSFV